MNFWKMAYNMNCIDAEQLKGAVKTEINKFGEITEEEYKTITGLDFSAS
ncbi:hypothetical protein AN1V17_26610 [Vallitalea sediminicola]